MKMALRPLLVLALVTPALALAACSSESSGNVTPQADTGPGDSGPGEAGPPDAPADAADAAEASAPVTLIQLTPADGAAHVSLVDPIKLKFSGSLKASSVTATSVQLLAPGATTPMTATVAYDDASHTITLTPKIVLYPAYVYRVVASGLQAADGAAIADAKGSFTTVYNALIDATTYDATTPTKITALSLYTEDAEGRTERSSNMAAGADGKFGTSDDVPSNWRLASYPATGDRSTFYTGAGADGVWYTADDVVGSRNEYFASAPFGHVRSATYGAAGTDGTWGTADDVLTTASDILAAADGLEASWTVFSSFGADATPWTADDVVSYYFADTRTGNTVRRVYYTAAGADGAWKTADDVIGGISENVYDADGRYLALRSFSKGPDGVWLTADDVQTSLWTRTYDASGLETRFTIYSGAGTDGAWGTADDVVSSYYASTHAANGATRERASYQKGADGVWFTADDVKIYAERYDATR
jgi:hypothetical protein